VRGYFAVDVSFGVWQQAFKISEKFKKKKKKLFLSVFLFFNEKSNKTNKKKSRSLTIGHKTNRFMNEDSESSRSSTIAFFNPFPGLISGLS
jgi:hypothetical protein